MIFLIIPLIALIYLFVKRADIIAVFAKNAFRKGDMKKASALFEKAEKAGSLSVSNQMFYGYLLLRCGKLEKARITLAKASMMPAKPALKNRIKAMRALVTWKEGDIKEAISSLEELIAEFKNSAVYQDLGLLYILDGNKEKALSFNLEAYDYNSDDLVIKDNLAEAYALCGDIENAERIYKELLELDPHFPEAYYGYGLLLVKKGEKQKGLELIKQSLDKRFSFLSVMQKEEVEALYNKYSEK